jgi:hypothetical protein
VPAFCGEAEDMTDSKQRRMQRGVWLRAALAFALVFLASLQPGMVAMANGAMHQVSVAASAADDHAHRPGNNGHDTEAVHQHALAGDAASEHDHHGDQATADVCCDLHCAPSSAVPVEHQAWVGSLSRVFAQPVSAAFLPGDSTRLIRPPRT